MTELERILARMREVREAIETLAAVPGDLSDEQRTQWDTLTGEWAELEPARAAEQARVDLLAGIRAAALDPARVESTNDDTTRDDGTEFQVGNTRTRDVFALGEIRAHPQSDEYSREVRDRALRSVEQWPDYATSEHREAAERLIRSRGRVGRDVARHALLYGNPDYVDAFYRMLGDPVTGAMALSDPQRRAVAEASRAAMAEGATTTGGFMVPVFIDPTIILTNNSATNPFRGISTVKTITTQTWKGVTSAGVTAEWTAEAAEAADASPTIAQPTITPVRADAYVQASFEMIEDTDIGMDIAMLFADARDRLEATAFAVGTGSTQPFGIVTELGLVTASRVAGSSGAAGAADFVVGDVYALKNALPPRHRPNSSWLAEQTTYGRIRQFATGSGPQHAFWADLGAAIPSLLLGRPAYESSEMDNTIVSGSNDDVLVFGDFRKYYIVDRIGMGVAYNPLVLGSNRRPTGEVGWFAFWRVGARAVDPGAFRMLRV